MDRREALRSIAGGLAAVAVGSQASIHATEQKHKKRLGIARFSYHIRSRAEQTGAVPSRITGPLDFLKHCHSIGAGGIQDNIGSRDESYISRLRRYAEDHDLFIEGSTSLPRDSSDVERFESQLRAARTVGARVVRIAIGGRRYEQFDRLEQYQAFADRSWKSIQLAEPVAARHRIRLAIENHKDFRVPQKLGMLEKLASEYVGVCIDMGNSFALLEDPMQVVQAFAPWAHSAHVKDMAVCEYEDGFLLADVTLGDGLLDLPKMVSILEKANPNIEFSLEMATRDALTVPCLTDKYWATFDDVSGADLARALRYVRTNACDEEALPKVSHLPLSQQVELEKENIKKCLRYAAERLNL
ncbi:MAG: sugar phosphate isomerase/epimerase [Phycisphaerales bacterium]|nr:MAG: sugar phosphate isomerase/epimerase [Phycisphaerales bacterium]